MPQGKIFDVTVFGFNCPKGKYLMLFGPNYRKEEYLIWGKDKMFGVFLYRRRLISALEPPPAVDWILGIHKLSKLKREKKKRN